MHYINITSFTREIVTDKTLVAKDGLHPSGKDYARWAEGEGDDEGTIGVWPFGMA